MDVLLNLLTLKMEFAIASVIIGAIAAIPYIIGLFHGHQPPYTTYLGWLLIGTTGFVFHLQAINPADAPWSAFLPALYILIPFTYIAILIYFKTKWHLETRDKVCLTGVFACWLVWVFAHTTGISGVTLPLVALVATDTFSSWPILEDAMKGKESGRGQKISWGLTSIASLLGALAVAEPYSAEMIYPGYLLVMMTAIAIGSLFSQLWVTPTRTLPAE